MSVINDIRTGAKTALDNAASLAQTFTARPASAGSFPVGWVDAMAVQINQSQGIRQWECSVDCIIAVSSFDNEEEMAALETAAQELMDYVADNPHLMGANTVVGSTITGSLTGVDFGDGTPRPALTVTLGEFYFQEGR